MHQQDRIIISRAAQGPGPLIIYYMTRKLKLIATAYRYRYYALLILISILIIIIAVRPNY
jgi:hypothetical protein